MNASHNNAIRRLLRSGLAALALHTACLAGAASAQAGPPEVQPTCQRACLEGFVDRYLQAMASRNVDPTLFAGQVRFTENGVEMPFGNEGLWATASGVGSYKFYVPDIETQQVAFLGTMMEQAARSATGAAREPEPVGLSLRLRIENGRISEVEQIVARPDRPVGPLATVSNSGFPPTGVAVERMGSPHPIYLQAVPERERRSRADLIRVANYYFDGLQRNDGKGYYPFTDDCLRYENGNISAGPPALQTAAWVR